MSGLVSDFARRNRSELGLLLAIVAVIAVTAVLDGSYLAKPSYNGKEILRQTSLLGIFALGAAVVIISGGIDLSSGSVIALSSTICVSILYALAPRGPSGTPVTEDLGIGLLSAAIGGTLLVAFMIGTLHAWLITAIRLPPFVATLASLVGLRSLARVLATNVSQNTSGFASEKMYVNDAMFRQFGTEWWIPLAVFFAIGLLLWLLMSRAVVGRHLYAMGGNEQAARLSGIRTDRLKWLAYCIGSMTAAVAGILYTGAVGVANPESLGKGYELNAIAAAVVGGCSLAGGIGTMGGAMLGALFLRTVIDAVAKVVKEDPDKFEGMIVGILVVLAVAVNELRDEGWLRKKLFPGVLGSFAIAVLAIAVGVVTALLSTEAALRNGALAAGAVLVLLTAKKALEVRTAR